MSKCQRQMSTASLTAVRTLQLWPCPRMPVSPRTPHPRGWAKARHSETSTEAHARLWHGSSHNRARAIKIERILSTLLFGPSYFGEWTLQLKHLNRNAKIQIVSSGLLKIYECFLASKLHTNIFMHFIKKKIIIKPNAVDFRACLEPLKVTILKYLFLNHLNSIFTYT